MRRPLFLVAVSFVIASGTASAQPPLSEPEVTFTAGTFEGLLMPETGRAEIPLTFRMTCPLPGSLTPFQVEFRPKESEGERYATVILNPPSFSLSLPPDKCAEPEYVQEGTSQAIVVTTREAPAYRSFKTSIEATVTNDGNTYGPYVAEFEISSDYVLLSIINPAQLYVKAGQGMKVVFPVEIQNLANGMTEYDLTVQPVNGSAFASLEVEPRVELESRVQVGAAAVYKQQVRVDAVTNRGDLYENRLETFHLNIQSRSSEREGSEAHSDTLAFAVQVQGTAGPTPAPSFLFAVFAAVAVCLVRFARQHR